MDSTLFYRNLFTQVGKPSLQGEYSHAWPLSIERIDIARGDSGITNTFNITWIVFINYCSYPCLKISNQISYSLYMLFKKNIRSIQMIMIYQYLFSCHFKCNHIFLQKYVHDLVIKVLKPGSLHVSCSTFVLFYQMPVVFRVHFFMNRIAKYCNGNVQFVWNSHGIHRNYRMRILKTNSSQNLRCSEVMLKLQLYNWNF